MEPVGAAFRLAAGQTLPPGLTAAGCQRSVQHCSATSPSTAAPSWPRRLLALEYGETFGFPVWINRCGVLAGAGQFGRADQGIFAFWINAWLRRRPLTYIGFGGKGYQVRDCLHPRDLIPLLLKQTAPGATAPVRVDESRRRQEPMPCHWLS